MATITLNDGRTLDVRVPQYLREKNAIVALDTPDATSRDLDWFNSLAAILQAAVRSTSWGGDVTEMGTTQILMTVLEWGRLTEDDVLPLPTGSASPTPLRKRTARSRTSDPSR